MCPMQSDLYMNVADGPAKAVFKLWKEKPMDISDPADMTFTINML